MSIHIYPCPPHTPSHNPTPHPAQRHRPEPRNISTSPPSPSPPLRYTLDPSSDAPPGLILDEEGIAWESDLDRRFAQPDGFLAQPNPGGGDCDTLLGTAAGGAVPTVFFPPNSSLPAAATAAGAVPEPWCVFYPEPEKFFYLFQRYPFFPNLGVEVKREGGKEGKREGGSEGVREGNLPIILVVEVEEDGDEGGMSYHTPHAHASLPPLSSGHGEQIRWSGP